MLTLREVGGRGRVFEWNAAASPIRIGRSPDATLPFDTLTDLSVSLNHAEIHRAKGIWQLSDVGSTNGTWVNGRRIGSSVRLKPGDRVELGSGGPVLEVVSIGALANMRTGVAIAVAVVALAGVVGGVGWVRSMQSTLAQEREALQQTVDSLLAVGESQEREFLALREGSEREVAELRDDLDRAREAVVQEPNDADPERLAQLQRELLAANARLERYRLAASIDADRIEADYGNAVALVFTQQANGGAVTGTAFAVTPDGVLVTAGHVADAAQGNEIAVRFANSTQTWRAEVLARSEDNDLALLRVRGIRGSVPTVRRISQRADTLGPGQPIAMIGFPLGGAPQDSADGAQIARSVLLVGITESTTAEAVTFDTYGRPGASGSPVFDANGDVIAVLIGGLSGSDAGTAFGAPALAVYALMQQAGITPPVGP